MALKFIHAADYADIISDEELDAITGSDDTLLPSAEFVAVTASAIVNGSLPHILALARNAHILMLGPSTPLAPALFDMGIGVLSGFVARDIDGLALAVTEGGAVAALRPFGRYVTRVPQAP